MVVVTEERRVCTKCILDKPICFFSLKAKGRFGRNAICKSCISNSNRERYKKDFSIKERSKVSSRLYTAKKHGLSKDELNNLYLLQNSKCGICGVTETEHGRYLAIDHDHLTGTVRGLLCMACNTGLGNFKDDIAFLNKAIDYLKKE